MSVVRLAEPVGMDKGQISPALAGLEARKLVAKAANLRQPASAGSLTKTGLAAHDATAAGALERNRRLLEQLGPEGIELLLGHIDRLTLTAAGMLAAERGAGLIWGKRRAQDGRRSVARQGQAHPPASASA